MSSRLRVAGLAVAAAGTLLAGGTAAALAQRTAVRNRRTGSGPLMRVSTSNCSPTATSG